jgi:hypothetical protein
MNSTCLVICWCPQQDFCCCFSSFFVDDSPKRLTSLNIALEAAIQLSFHTLRQKALFGNDDSGVVITT